MVVHRNQVGGKAECGDRSPGLASDAMERHAGRAEAALDLTNNPGHLGELITAVEVVGAHLRPELAQQEKRGH